MKKLLYVSFLVGFALSSIAQQPATWWCGDAKYRLKLLHQTGTARTEHPYHTKVRIIFQGIKDGQLAERTFFIDSNGYSGLLSGQCLSLDRIDHVHLASHSWNPYAKKPQVVQRKTYEDSQESPHAGIHLMNSKPAGQHDLSVRIDNNWNLFITE